MSFDENFRKLYIYQEKWQALCEVLWFDITQHFITKPGYYKINIVCIKWAKRDVGLKIYLDHPLSMYISSVLLVLLYLVS